MKNLFSFVLVVLVVGVLLSGCVDNENLNNTNSNTTTIKEPMLKIDIKNITTDQPRYTSNNKIVISTEIESSKAFKNATLRLYGIKSRQGSYLFDNTQNINLTKGINTINFTVTAPTCTHGCGARYYPGDYDISAQLSYPNESAPNTTITSNFTTKVNLY